MKAGDLVRMKHIEISERPLGGIAIDLSNGGPGLVIEVIKKKVFRADKNFRVVNWDKIEPEPHAVVAWAYNLGTFEIPTIDLEVINESR